MSLGRLRDLVSEVWEELKGVMPTIQQSGARSLHSAPHSWLELGEQCWSLSEPRCLHAPLPVSGETATCSQHAFSPGAGAAANGFQVCPWASEGGLPRGHTCSLVTSIHRARCRPQCIATVPIRWHPVWNSRGHMRVVLWNR